MGSKKTFLIAPLVMVIMIGLAAEAPAGYRTYVVRPAINNNAILDDAALPAECRDETVMKMMACRGEYEPASLLIETDEPLEQVMVWVGALKGAAGAESSSLLCVRSCTPSPPPHPTPTRHPE